MTKELYTIEQAKARAEEDKAKVKRAIEETFADFYYNGRIYTGEIGRMEFRGFPFKEYGLCFEDILLHFLSCQVADAFESDLGMRHKFEEFATDYLITGQKSGIRRCKFQRNTPKRK